MNTGGAATLPCLLDLLNKYRDENPSDCCNRLSLVIAVLEKLRDETRASIEQYKAGLPILCVDEKETELPLIVVWYDTPFFFWKEQTYAVFMVSFIASFFNPLYQIEGSEALNAETDTQEIKQIQSQFGRILKYIHSESAVLEPYFDQIWQYGNKTSLDWRTANMYQVFNRVITRWSTLLGLCNSKGNDVDQKGQLFEAIHQRNIELLQKGLEIPLVMSHMLMHYYNAKLNEISALLIKEALEEEELNGESEIVATETAILQEEEIGTTEGAFDLRYAITQ